MTNATGTSRQLTEIRAKVQLTNGINFLLLKRSLEIIFVRMFLFVGFFTNAKSSVI